MQQELWTSHACSHGDEERRNRVYYEFHAFSLITVASLAVMFLGSQKLKRIYRPLYLLVNAILLLQLLSDVLYFSRHPYTDMDPGNCGEILVNRVVVFLTMFGELHQLYFVANVLGMQSLQMQLCNYTKVTLESGLRIAIVCVTLTVFLSFFVKRLFMVCHDFWALFIIAAQLHVLHCAQKKDHDEETAIEKREGAQSAIVDARSDAVQIFQTISWLQLMPLLVALADRVLEFEEIFLLPSLDGVMLILEFLSTYLFFLKILVLQEKASSVHVDV